jgi:hypothetical protein
MNEREVQMIARSAQPLIGIPTSDDRVEYFIDESEIEAASDAQTAQRAIDLLGAWSDLDWETAAEELDRIRHESTPTPPNEEV